MKTSALWFTAAGQAEVREETIAEPREGEVLLQAAFSALSNGTEHLVFSGEVPPEEYQSMACPYMQGEFTFPVKYGYSLVGKIIQGQDEGCFAHVLHPHQQHCVVQHRDLILLPPGVSPERATLLSNAETALNAVWDAQLKENDSVLVVGYGNVGSLLCRVLQLESGCTVDVLDSNEQKQRLAADHGFTGAAGHDYDVVFHTSASSKGLQAAIDLAGFEGRIIELSWYGNRPVTLSLGGSFHRGRKQLISSQVSTVAVSKRDTIDFAKRKMHAMKLLEDQNFDSNITRKVTLAEAARDFAGLRNELACLIYYE